MADSEVSVPRAGAPGQGRGRLLRVLYVEDDQDDVYLVTGALEDAGFEPRVVQVTTEAALRQALREETWDLLLADYRVPGLEIEEVLALYGTLDDEMPLIVVSGAVGEEQAVALMRNGADDFVLKEHLDRLGSAVTRALKQGDARRQLKQAEEGMRRSEARFRNLVQYGSDMITLLDADGVIRYESPSVTRILGYQPGENVGHSAFELVHPDDLPRVMEGFRSLIAEGGRPVMEFRYRSKDRGWRWLEATGTNLLGDPAVAAVVINSRDVSERKEIEWRAEFLAEASQVLASSLDYEVTLRAVARLVVPRLADWCSVVVKGRGETMEQVAVAHVDPDRVAWGLALQKRYPPDPNAPRGLANVLRTGRAELYPEITDEMLAGTAVDEEHLSILKKAGFRSVAIVPLNARGETLGALTLVWSETDRRYTEDDLRFAEALGQRVAVAVENARLFQESTRSAERMARLQAVTAALSEAVTPAEVAEVIIEQGLAALGVAAGTLAVLAPDGRSLELERFINYDPAFIAPWRTIPLDAPFPIAEAVRTGRPVWLESEEAILTRYPALAPARSHTGSRALAAIPLQVERRVLGAIGLSFKEPQPFEAADRDFMLALARQAAQALERARLYEAERRARAEQEEALALLDTLFSAAPVALGFLDRDYRYVRVNEALSRIHGKKPDEYAGNTIHEVVPDLAPRLKELFDRILETGEPVKDLELSGLIPNTSGKLRHWLANYFPVRARGGSVLGIGLAIIEVTERKRAEETSRFLAEATSTLYTSLDDERTLWNVARLAVRQLADFSFVDVLEADGQIRRVSAEHRDPDQQALVWELMEYPPDAEDREGIAEVLRSGTPRIFPALPDGEDVEEAQEQERFREILRALGAGNWMVVPLVVRGNVIGAVSFVCQDEGWSYGPEELSLARELVDRAAVAVDNARLYQAAQAEIADRRRAEEELRESQAFLNSIIEHIPNHIFVKEARNLRFVRFNRAAELMFGIYEAELLGKTDFDFFPQEEAAHFQAKDREVLQSGRLVDIPEEPVHTRFGGMRYLHTKKIPILDAEGHPQYLLGISEDITERKQQEEELAFRAQELVRLNKELAESNEKLARSNVELLRSNKELEQFAYVASHDLREPLRSVSSSVQYLAHRYRGQVDEEADQVIQFAVDGVKRMDRLIGDVLALSQLGTQVRPWEKVDLNEVVDQVRRDLKARLEEAGAMVEHEELPDLWGDRAQFEQLFLNLISNAVKFRHPERPCRVRITAEKIEDGWEFAVADNGIGIEPTYGERIFQPFKRLHTQQEYEGTGIGLAIVKKIIEQHGGRIWVESEPGQGCVFRFTLPVS